VSSRILGQDTALHTSHPSWSVPYHLLSSLFTPLISSPLSLSSPPFPPLSSHLNLLIFAFPLLSPQDTFPPALWNFLSSSVKKSSGLLKRLLRLSEIWLYEYKDFQGFKKRSHALLFDYIKRSLFKAAGAAK
jgi:hypothetical protein